MPWIEAPAAASKAAAWTVRKSLLEEVRNNCAPSQETKTGRPGRFPIVSALALLVSMASFNAAAAQQAPAAQPIPPIPAAPMPHAFPAAPLTPVQPRFVVVLDAAHGSADTGARLGTNLLEKDLVLALSVRLRSMLSARGIAVTTTRESDANLSPVNRAETANHAGGAACISLHATATGSGIHLFTSSLAPKPASRFLPWQSAQSAFITQSLRLSSEINSAMAHAQVPVNLGRTSMQPLDSFACPAVAVEIAPLAVPGADTTALTDASYQARIVDALAAAIQQWREDWRQQP
jgi:N-acetylmuramoyl-L-alanine amidase